MLNTHTSSHAASCNKEAVPLDSSRNSSNISDGDCGDVDEMIVISA